MFVIALLHLLHEQNKKKLTSHEASITECHFRASLATAEYDE